MNAKVEQKFTPGPWKIDELNTLSIIDDSGDNFHGLICQTNGKGREEAYANARLIAMAPEMLEALKGMCQLWNRMYDDPIAEDYHTAMKVIQKATQP